MTSAGTSRSTTAPSPSFKTSSVLSAWGVRLRHWLDENLFPPAPSAKMSMRRISVVAGIAVLSVVVLMARMWPSKPLNTIYAEDGYIWLADALRHGFFHNLATPYNGYLQTLPRLVAEGVSLLPVDWYGAAMALSGAIIVTGCALVVWWASAAHVRSPLLRLFLASMVVLLPIVGTESLDNVTNSIWFLLFACFWVLLWRPASVAGAVLGAVVILIATLSDAGALLFLPIWALRVIAIRDLRDGLIATAYAVGLGIQLVASWHSTNQIGEANFPQYRLAPHWDWALLPAYLQRVVGGALSGQRITGFLWVHLGIPFEVVLGALVLGLIVAAFCWGNWHTRAVVTVMVTTSLGIFLFSGYQRWTTAGYRFLWSAGSSWPDASHYMIVPTLLVLSAIVVVLDAKPPVLSSRVWSTLTVGLVAFVAVAALLNFNVSGVSRGTTTWNASLQPASISCTKHRTQSTNVLIAPDGVVPVYMQVPCSTLIGSRAPSFPNRYSVLLAPSRSTILSGTTLLRARVSDDEALDYVSFYLEPAEDFGKYMIAHRVPSGWSTTFDTKRVPNGSYNLQALATYQGGDVAISSPVAVIVRN